MRTLVERVAKRLRLHATATGRRTLGLYERPIRDIVVYEIQSHVKVAVYWKALPNGGGPGASLYVYDEEVLRFDCFGAGRGHYHANLSTAGWGPKADEHRLFFREQAVAEQIERAGFELMTNVGYYLRRNRDPRVRDTVLDPQRLAAAVEQMKATMRDYARVVSAREDT